MILVYGTVCLDRLRQVPDWPTRGGYVEMSSDQIFLGGEAANTASHLVRWNCEVVLAGNGLGGGDDGANLRHLLDDHGLAYDRLPGGGITPLCEVYVTPDGERTMIGKGFSTMEFSTAPSEIPWESGKWFTAEPNIGEAAREIVRTAGAAGMHIYLMDFFRENDPIVPGSFWQCSTDWIGTRGDTDKNIRFVEDWIAKYQCFTILTDGPGGFVAGGPGMHPQHYYSPRAPKNLDATGAGDSFRAGMLYGLSHEWPIEKCLRFAAASGSLKCGSLGGASSRHTVEQTLRLASL